MGIRPNGSGAIPPVTPDNPETRYSDWLTDLEDSGEIVGGVWQETDAKATSANNSVSDLAGRVGNLENAPVKPHTHVSADITDTTSYFGSEASANRVVTTRTDGQLHSSRDPSSGNHLARKAWVDQQVSALEGRVSELEQDTSVSEHTHTMANITDLPDIAALTQRIADLERVDTITGTNWVAKRQGKVVFVDFGPVTEGWTFPAGWRPGEVFQTPCFSIDDPNPAARIAVSTAGETVFYGFTGRAYGAFSFITA